MNNNFFKKLSIFSEIKRGFNSFSKREKWLVIGSLALTLFVILDLALIRPVYQNSVELKKEVAADKLGLIEMRRLYAEHKKYEIVLRGNESVPANFSILTYLESIANTIGISYDSIQPRTSSDNSISYVDVRLKNINLYQLVNLLYKIEIGGQYQLKIKRLNVRRSYNSPSVLNVGLEVVVPGESG